MHLFVRKACYCCWYPLLRIPVSMSKATNKIDLNPICTESYQPTAVYSFEFYDVSFLLFWCSNFHVHGHNVWYNCCHVWLQVTRVPVLHLQLRGCLAISAESGTSPSGIEPILRKQMGTMVIKTNHRCSPLNCPSLVHSSLLPFDLSHPQQTSDINMSYLRLKSKHKLAINAASQSCSPFFRTTFCLYNNFRLVFLCIYIYTYIYIYIFNNIPHISLLGPSDHRHVGAPQQPRSAAVDPGFLGRPPRRARGPQLRGAAPNGHEAAEFADAGGELQGAGGWTGTVVQGLVNVPFWVYWTSPYSSHYRPYT